MRDHHNALSLTVQLREDIRHVTSGSRAQAAGRLIGKQNLRVIHDGTDNADTLTLTAGKLIGIFLPCVFPHADFFQKLLNFSDKFGRIFLRHQCASHHIIKDGHICQKINALEHESAMFSAEHRKLIVGQSRNILVTEIHLSECRLIHAGQRIEQCGFAGTG